MGEHTSRAIGHIHVAHNWEYADATARAAATGFVAADLKKLALQLDNSSYWVLTATTPTWAPVGGGGTGVTVTGTPTSGQIAEWTSATNVQGKAVTGSGNVVLATSPTLVTPALGTPASGVLTNATGLPVSTGVAGLGTGIATFLATPTSANLAAALTDETGTGANVFATSPTLVTPALGTPSAIVLTNATAVPAGQVVGVIPIANLATGTPNGSKYVRDDGTLQTPSAGGSPGGSDTQLQRNNAGAFGGISGATTNGTVVTFASQSLLATKPKITTGLDDANGQGIVAFTPTASAANYINITNAVAAGTGPVIAADGSDAAVRLNLSAKGAQIVTIKGTYPGFLSRDAADAGKNQFQSAIATDDAIAGSAADDLCIVNFIASKTIRFSSKATTQTTSFLINSGTGTIVNYVAVTPSITAVGPTLAAAGTDTNVRLTLSAKGAQIVTIKGSYPGFLSRDASDAAKNQFQSANATDDAIVGAAVDDVCIINYGTTKRILFSTSGGVGITHQLTAGGAFQSSTPAGGTAGAWKFGIRVAATVALDTTQYVQLDVGGTLYKVAIAT